MRIALVLVVACCPPEPVKAPVVTHVVPVADAASATPVDAAPAGPPAARTVDVVDTPFGLTVPDPYRWMETDAEGYLREQGAYATEQLAKLPDRDKLFARIKELGGGVTAVFGVELANGRMFHMLLPASEQLAKLVVRMPDGSDKVLVDPATLGTADAHAALGRYAASPDGKYLAYNISYGGSEDGTIHVLEVATGKVLPDEVPRVRGENVAAWLPDSSGFFYEQMVERKPGVDPVQNQTIHFHALGAKADSGVIFGIGSNLTFAPEEWPGVWPQLGTTWAVATAGGAHDEIRIAIAPLAKVDYKTGKTPWREVATYADGVDSAIVHGDRLYLTTFKGSSNKRLVSVPLANPDLAKARVEIPEDPDAVLVDYAVARDAMYILYRVDGRARLARWPWTGKPAPIALPVDGWVPDMASEATRDGLLFQAEGWVAPGAYYTTDGTTVTPAGLKSVSSADTSDLVAEEVFATSADGTKVPLSILHKKDLPLDGTHPAILYGYAAYGSSETPGFGATRIAWTERGGVFAIAHGRGGGEKGHAWQEGGSHEHKLDGVHDFEACAQYLIDHRYTSAARLGAMGVSMGGVLVGRAITERPELFAAANLGSGIVNPLRILAAENGANQKVELGDPDTEAGYRSILAMDPYAHVEHGVSYPAVIFTVGLNDRRVAPWMSAKMAARLQASSASGRPVLVRVDADAGHGIGSTRDQAFLTRADVWAFFLAAFTRGGL